MWTTRIRLKYKIEAITKKDVAYLFKKYRAKKVMDGDRLYLIPSNTKTLKIPNSKLFPDYDGLKGRVKDNANSRNGKDFKS